MRRALAFLAVCSLLVSCVTVWAARFAKPGITPVDANAPFLKVHTEEGEVYVLTEWVVDTTTHLISGTGRRCDISRALLPQSRAAADLLGPHLAHRGAHRHHHPGGRE
jgi:hypothetical protein